MSSSDPLMLVAGSTTGDAGFTDGFGTDARFRNPWDVKLSADGSKLYIADVGNNSIRVMDTATLEVTTLITWASGYYPWAIAVAASGNIYVSVGVWATGASPVYKVEPDGTPTLIATSAGIRVDEVDPTETFLVISSSEFTFTSSFNNAKYVLDIATGIFTNIAPEGAFVSCTSGAGCLSHDEDRFFVAREYISPSGNGMYLLDAADGSNLDLFSVYDAPQRWGTGDLATNSQGLTRGPAAGPTMCQTRYIFNLTTGDNALVEWDYDPTTYEPDLTTRDRGELPYQLYLCPGVAYTDDVYYVSATSWSGCGDPASATDEGDKIYGHAIFSTGLVSGWTVGSVAIG